MAGRLEKTIRAVINLISSALFTYVVFNNYQLYREGSTTLVVTYEKQSVTPPVIVCPYMPLSPLKLLDFNLDLKSGDTNFLGSYHALSGVSEKTSIALLLNHTKLPLGTFIEGVRIGDVTESYAENTKLSPLWKTSKLNVLCHELQSLPVTDSANLVIQFRNKPIIDIFLNGSLKTEEVLSDMTLSSIYDMHIAQFLKVYVPFERGYTLSNWASPLRLTHFPAQIHFQCYSVTLVHWHSSDKAEECQLRCYEAHAKNIMSCFPVYPDPTDKLRKPCVVSSFIDAEIPCFRICGNPISVNRWRVVEDNHSSKVNTLNITVQRGKKAIVEKALYSSYQFYSDIGGCLGFFLGVSFLTAFEWLKESLLRLGFLTRVQPTALVTLSVYLLLLLGTATHILMSLVEVSRQPLQTFVTLGSQGRNDGSLSPYSLNQSAFEPFSPETQWVKHLLAKRFAMRAFGCRSESNTDPIVHCILQNQTSVIVGILPFLNLSDLPVCVEGMKRLPALKYTVPADLLTIPHDHKVMAKCVASTVNTDNYTKDMPSELKFLVNRGYYHKHFDVFVEIGGITGLYLGISILSALRNALKKKFSDRNLASFPTYLQNIIRVILIITSLIAGSWQLYTFLFNHPLFTQTKVYPLEDDVPLSITICQWPPLNTTRLLESILHPDDVLQLKKNHSGTLLGMALNEMALKFSQNTTLFHSAWLNALWSFSAIEDGVEKITSWDDLYLLGQKCFTSELKPPCTISNKDHNHPLQYVSIHARGDIPLLNVYYKVRVFRWSLSKISTYHHYGGESKEQYGRCLNSCFQKRLSHTYKCHLPFQEGFYAGTNCNSSVIFQLLKWSIQSVPNTNEPYPFMSDIKTFHEVCKLQCHRTSKIFLEVNDLSVRKTLVTAGFTVAFQKETIITAMRSLTTQEVIEEVDGFTPFQLIGKIGSTTGVLLGESIGSLFVMIFKSIRLMI